MAPDEQPEQARPKADFYNNVFERLVDDAEDSGHRQLIGLVAYGLYKLGKREWVISRKEEDGVSPSEETYRAYAKAQNQTVLDGYRAQAEQILGAYANSVLESERPRIFRDAIKGSFMRSFWPSLAASVAFAAILALIVVIAALNGTGFPIDLSSPG